MAAGDGLTRGQISSGIQLNALVDRTIDFVYAQLPNWRDDPDRSPVDAENLLNLQLCKYMNWVARRQFSMVHFNPEEPQVERRKVDISATPDETIEIHTHRYTKYDPFLVIEGKRLPTPGPGRTREYVTGGKSRTGGIQRFRLGLHGNLLATAVMIGYLQSDSTTTWHKQINDWIKEELTSPTDTTCTWSAADELGPLQTDTDVRAAACTSSHERTDGVSDQISLRHLWIEMSTDSKNV